MDNVEQITVPGAQGQVEVSGAHGILFRILQDGAVVKPRKGVWELRGKGGNAVQVRARGFFPGFVKLAANSQVIYSFGHYVPAWLRAITLLPFLIIVLNPLAGLVFGMALFISNVLIVKNQAMPLGLRVALPVVNAVAAGLVVLLLSGSFQQA